MHAPSLEIRGPLGRTDLPGLRERARRRLQQQQRGALDVRLVDVDPDLIAVDALAGLVLVARQAGCTVRVHGIDPLLCRLIELSGLRDALDP